MTVRVKYFIAGAVVTLLLSASLGFASKFRHDEQELKRIRKELTLGKDVSKVTAFYLKRNPKLWESLAKEMATATVNAASAFRIPLDVQVGVVASESDFHPFAVSRTGAKGLGQVNFSVWKDELPSSGNPFEPKFNQEATAYVLSRSIRKHGLYNGLQIYNLGEGNYRKGRRNHRYVNRVFAEATEFRYFQE